MENKKDLDKQIYNELKKQLQFDYKGTNIVNTKEIELIKEEVEKIKSEIFSLFEKKSKKKIIQKGSITDKENKHKRIARKIVSKKVNLVLDSMVENEEIFELSQETKQTINEMLLQPLEQEKDKEIER